MDAAKAIFYSAHSNDGFHIHNQLKTRLVQLHISCISLLLLSGTENTNSQMPTPLSGAENQSNIK